MPSASSILQASTEKINELFGRRFLHSRDAMMAADYAASPILELLVKMQV